MTTLLRASKVIPPSEQKGTPSDFVLVEKEAKAPSPPERVLNKGTSQMASGLSLASGRGLGKSRSRGRTRRSGALTIPPELDATVSFTKTYRFVGQDLVGTQRTVTVSSLMQALGCVAITTTQLTTMCSSFRIKKVTIYPAANSATLTLFEWVEASSTGLNVRDERKNRPLPLGVTVGDVLVIRPPGKSQMSWWWDGSAASVALFALSAPVGSVLDLQVEATINNTGTQIQDNTYTGLTVGLTYYPALEGRSTNDWAPVGRLNAT